MLLESLICVEFTSDIASVSDGIPAFSAFTERQFAPLCITREVTHPSSTNSDTQWPKKQTARMRAAASERLHATLMSDVLRPASAHFSNPTICADDNSAELEPSHSHVSNGFSALLIEPPRNLTPFVPFGPNALLFLSEPLPLRMNRDAK